MEFLTSIITVPIVIGLCFYGLVAALFLYDKIFLVGSFLLLKVFVDRSISFESYYLEWKKM